MANWNHSGALSGAVTTVSARIVAGTQTATPDEMCLTALRSMVPGTAAGELACWLAARDLLRLLPNGA